MQGRAVAVYGLVLALVAVGAFGYATTAEAPEPSIDDPEHTVAVNQSFSIGDRTYTLNDFGEIQGSPTALIQWTDEDARSSEQWEHADEPGGTSITHDEREFWVRIPQTADPSTFTLLEQPGENASFSVFTDDEGNWLVNDDGTYVDLEDFDRLERLEVEDGGSIEVGEGEDVRTVRVDGVTNESVTVSWNDPSTVELEIRQAKRSELNGQNATVHVPGDGTAHFTTDEGKIDAYIADHEDKDDFNTRMDGLLMTSTLTAVSLLVLIGLAFLPRKE